MITMIISRHGDEETAICICGNCKIEGKNSLETLIRSIEHVQQVHYEGIIRVNYLVDTADILVITERGMHLIDRRIP